MKQETALLHAFRRERFAGVWLAVLLLLSPYLQPLSEAIAAGKPFAGEICTSFGNPGKTTTPAMADDCPDCLLNTMAQALVALPAHSVGLPQPVWNESNASAGNAINVSDTSSKRWLAPPGQGPPSLSWKV